MVGGVFLWLGLPESGATSVRSLGTEGSLPGRPSSSCVTPGSLLDSLSPSPLTCGSTPPAPRRLARSLGLALLLGLGEDRPTTSPRAQIWFLSTSLGPWASQAPGK